MRIAIDVMGGDNAPQEIIKGALMAQEKNQEIELVLVGPKDIIQSNLESASPRGKVEIVHASEVIGFDETPTTAIRRKKDSTIVVGLNLVKDKNVQAFVSAGSLNRSGGGKKQQHEHGQQMSVFQESSSTASNVYLRASPYSHCWGIQPSCFFPLASV